jgi:hypothetical protein
MKNTLDAIKMAYLARLLLLSLAVSISILTALPPTLSEETIEVESAVIRCDTDEEGGKGTAGGDDKAVNWKPKPLTSFNETVGIGPHDAKGSDLKADVENDLELQIISSPLCLKQAVITIKISNEGQVEIGDGALIKIDHMLDEKTGRPARLGQPLAIKIQPGPLFKLYPVNYLYSVNAQAREQIINYENTPDFVGCDDMETPTCGFEHDANGPIQSSRGFCCPCGPGKEDSSQRQLRGKQQCSGNGVGENRTTTTPPSPAAVGNSPAYHSSAHCLRWSKYWYAVHELGPPEIFRQLYVQVYQNLEDENGTVGWSPLGDLLRIDSHNQSHVITNKTISVTYRKVSSTSSSTSSHANQSPFNATNQLILIPKPYFKPANETKAGSTNDTIPSPFRGTLENTYLVVPKSIIDLSGKQCDRIGVNHDAFKGQPSPCKQSQGACLKNQPFNLWAADSDEKVCTHAL